MPNINYRGQQSLTSYRRVAIASWRHPRDPSTYSMLELPVDREEERLRAMEGHPTLTHYMARVLALTLSQQPALNHVLRHGKLYRRDKTHVFITTLLRTPQGKDLSGFLIREAANKSVGEIAQECARKTAELRTGENGAFGTSQRLLGGLPTWLLRGVLFIQDLLQCNLNLSLKGVGVPDDPFGSVMLTNVGALGIDNALVPLSPYTRCPLIVSLGKPRDTPWADAGTVTVRRCASVCFTFDHRYADGAHGALFLRRFQKLFHDPDRVLAASPGERQA